MYGGSGGGFRLAAGGELLYGFGARDALHTASANLKGPSTAPVSPGASDPWDTRTISGRRDGGLGAAMAAEHGFEP